MVQPKPPHLHAKFLSRKRLTLSAPMAKRLDAFHARFPTVSKATLARIARKDSRILEITPDTCRLHGVNAPPSFRCVEMPCRPCAL